MDKRSMSETILSKRSLKKLCSKLPKAVQVEENKLPDVNLNFEARIQIKQKTHMDNNVNEHIDIISARNLTNRLIDNNNFAHKKGVSKTKYAALTSGFGNKEKMQRNTTLALLNYRTDKENDHCKIKQKEMYSKNNMANFINLEIADKKLKEQNMHSNINAKENEKTTDNHISIKNNKAISNKPKTQKQKIITLDPMRNIFPNKNANSKAPISLIEFPKKLSKQSYQELLIKNMEFKQKLIKNTNSNPLEFKNGLNKLLKRKDFDKKRIVDIIESCSRSNGNEQIVDEHFSAPSTAADFHNPFVNENRNHLNSHNIHVSNTRKRYSNLHDPKIDMSRKYYTDEQNYKHSTSKQIWLEKLKAYMLKGQNNKPKKYSNSTKDDDEDNDKFDYVETQKVENESKENNFYKCLDNIFENHNSLHNCSSSKKRLAESMCKNTTDNTEKEDSEISNSPLNDHILNIECDVFNFTFNQQ